MRDFGYEGNNNGSGHEQDASNTRKGKKHYHRHTTYQIQQLEEFFKECPHPDDNQRRQLSRELGLEPKQIKFWFQNKRTQTKAQNERVDNNALKVENEKIQCENLAIREALKNVICPSCGGPPFGEEERQLNLQKLKLENAHLKQEYERISDLVANFLGSPVGQIQSLNMSRLVVDLQQQQQQQPEGDKGILGSGAPVSACLDHFDNIIGINSSNCNMQLYDHFSNHETQSQLEMMEKSPSVVNVMNNMDMIETAVSAMDELMRLLRANEPVWIKSPNIDGGGYVLHRESYNKLFPRPHNHFKTTTSNTSRIESSKDSGVVPMRATHLLDMFLDSNKWMDLFPTIVTKARTIEVIDTRMLGDEAGSLKLMYEEMHILSPLVAPREFYFLRYCRKVEPGVWVMVDVSYDQYCSRSSGGGGREDNHASDPLINRSSQRRLPSGCMLQDKSNGCCEVTWVEHVEVDDKPQTHRLYRDLVCNSSCSASSYGAQRWIVTLQRMSERLLAYSAATRTASLPYGHHQLGLGGVIDVPGGRERIMDLSQRMVKNFWGMLSMSGGSDKIDFPHLLEVNNSGVRVSVRQSSSSSSSNEPSQPAGIIVSAVSSLWLPLSSEALFNFLQDDKTRPQWDVLSNGNSVNEIAHISYGTHPGNCISIIQPLVPNRSNTLMLQESCIDSLGSLVVYAPINLPAIKSAISGEDSVNIPILPSGFIISGDGRPPPPEKLGFDSRGGSISVSAGNYKIRTGGGGGGSLLTVAFQILVCSPLHSKQLNMESVATINTLVSSTVQKIKVALDCCNLD